MRALRGSPKDILRPDVNVVVSRRLASTPAGLPAALRHSPEWSQTVTARRDALPAAIAQLLQPINSLALRAALHGQLVEIAREYSDVLGYSQVDATLECIRGQMCPRFHSDVVTVRCLCTLCGPGTEFVEDRHVDRARLRSLPRGDVAGWSAIASRSAVRQAAPGEVLYLKGARFPGAEGRGAVHRSPQAPAAGPGAGPRLLLKLDPPAEGQGCGCAAHHH